MYGLFSNQKVDGNMIFTDYRKLFIFNFSEMRKTVFLWTKKLIETWYLLITEDFLFSTFRWWEIRYFHRPKSWWKDDINSVFLSFPWVSIQNRRELVKVFSIVTSIESLVLNFTIFSLTGVSVVCELCIFQT